MKLTKTIRFIFFPIMVATLLLAGEAAMAGSKDEKDKAVAKAEPKVRTGMASWYGTQFQGKKTSTGELFDMEKFTCASNQFPLGTWLKVTNARSGKSVVVRVNDRMHPRMKRIVDLSKGAAKQLGMISAGVAKVTVEELGTLNPNRLR